MRRRKLLIGLGALSAGGGAAFGTEAFTSVQAERNVDVAVAGDRSSFVAIQPLSSSNANKYVDTESDNTVALELDGDNSGSGEGVSQDAITQIEDLFRVVNQGSQEVSVYFEDDSEAVTFRVTRSTNTSTSGSNGASLEGPDNSVELEVGEQVVVGMTVDTLNNDVSGQLLDSVVVYADANPSAPQQSITEPQYVVTGSPTGGNEFGDIQSAIDAAEAGAVIGIDGSFAPSLESQINVDVADVTLTGFNGTPTIDLTAANPSGNSAGAVQISASGVTLRNFNIDYEADANGIEANDAGLSDITVDGMRVRNTAAPSGQPAINFEKAESVTVTNNVVSGAAIGTFFTTSNQNTSTISNNYVDLNPNNATVSSGGPTEGIFAFGSGASNTDLEIRNNEVVNHDVAGVNAKEIKLIDDPASVNGESDTAAQIESLLTENSVNSVQVNSDAGTRATPDIVGAGQQFASVNEVLQPSVFGSGGDVGKPAGSALVALFEDGEYDAFEDPVELNRADAVIKGLSRPRLKYDGGYPGSGGAGITFSANGISVEDIEIDFLGAKDDPSKDNFSGGADGLIDASNSNVTFRNSALNAVFIEEDGSANFDGAGGVSLSATRDCQASFIGTDISLLDRQAGRPVSLNGPIGRPGGFFVIGQEIRDCTLRGGPKIATGNLTDITIQNNRITDVSSTESLAIDSSATSVVVEGNSIEYDDATFTGSRPAFGGGSGGVEIRMESSTTDVNGQNRTDAEAVADELSEANSGSQLASGNAKVVNRSTSPNTFAP